jgi:hypothetical protein
MANDLDRNQQHSGQQQHGDPHNRADNLDEQLKRKQNEGVNNPENATRRQQDQGINRPDREGSENIEKKRSA